MNERPGSVPDTAHRTRLTPSSWERTVTAAAGPHGAGQRLYVSGEKHPLEGGLGRVPGPYTDAPNPLGSNQHQHNLPAWRRKERERGHEEPKWDQRGRERKSPGPALP